MTQPTPISIPRDAMSKGPVKDFYADMTDEERAEEELPPREPAKAEAQPDAKPDATPAVEATPEAKPDAKPDAKPEAAKIEDSATERLFEEIEGLREDLNEKLAKPGAAPTAKEPDALLEAALEHDDPVIRGLAERLQEAEKRLGQREAEAHDERISRQLAKDQEDFETLQASYTIGGKPMTDAHVDKIEKYMIENPEAGRILTIEECMRRVYPDAVKAAPKPSPARGPDGKFNAAGPPAATIVTEGSAGGSPGEPWKPRANESIETAVQAAGERLFGIKR